MLDIRPATLSDNTDLLQLTARTPMAGAIGLLIDRQPDFFNLLRLRGNSQTFLARDAGQLAGSFSVSRQTMSFQGQEMPVDYLSDLKIHPDYRGRTTAIRLFQYMHAYLEGQNSQLLLATVASGNAAMNALLGGRLGLPPFQKIGAFRVMQLLPLPWRPLGSGFGALTEEPAGEPEITDLLLTALSPYTLHPFAEPAEGTSCREFNLVLRQNSRPVAALRLIDTQAVKQNIVVHMPRALDWLGRASRKLGAILPVPRLPETGQPIRMLYLRFWACAPGYEPALWYMLRHARYRAWQEGYTFLAAAVHERDPAARLFWRYPKITFHSDLVAASLQRDDGLLSALRAGLLFEDYSMI